MGLRRERLPRGERTRWKEVAEVTNTHLFARAAGVDALKGAVARAWCAPPSEVGGVVQQFFAPKRLANCQLLGSSVATAAPPELALA